MRQVGKPSGAQEQRAANYWKNRAILYRWAVRIKTKDGGRQLVHSPPMITPNRHLMFTLTTDFAIVRPPGSEMGLEPNYIIIDGQNFSKAKLALDNHVYKNCQIDDCDLYYSGGQYELLDTHITNSRLILNHPAKGIYNALQIFKMKSPGSRIVFE
jgi:hypothetical protein